MILNFEKLDISGIVFLSFMTKWVSVKMTILLDELTFSLDKIS